MGRSLSGRLLWLTLVAVMVIEVVIFVPSVARFREDWLRDRLRMAELASLALLATPEEMLDPDLESALLTRAGALSIVLRRDGARALVLSQRDSRPVAATVDLRNGGVATRVAEALADMVRPEGRLIRVLGIPWPDAPDEVEVTLDDGPLLAAMRAYGLRILQLSLLISVTTAAVIWLMMQRLLLRPMAALARNMAAFREDPEDAARVMRPGSRVREIRVTESALAEMQTQLREALRQRARLAALGEAVARISHDLRNILSTAQLLADRLDGSNDPAVRRVGPKLLGSLDRAITLCESTLRYGRAEEAAPVPRRINLLALAAEVGESVMPEGPVQFENAVPEGLVAEADPDQTFRVLANLTRNAVEAIEGTGRPGLVRISAAVVGDAVAVEIADTGPGLPMQALDHLFQPFRGNARQGGSGLGLAIAHDLMALQGGRLELVSTDTTGTVFRVVFPARQGRHAARPMAVLETDQPIVALCDTKTSKIRD